MKTSAKEYLTPGHKRLEIGAWALVALTLALAVYGGCTVKGSFPTHYGVDGQANSYGSAWILLLYPVLGALVLGILSLVAHGVSPETWNLPFSVREERKAPVFRDMLTMIFLLEGEIAAMFLAATVLALLRNGTATLVLTLLFLAAATWTLIHWCRKAARDNRAEGETGRLT